MPDKQKMRADMALVARGLAASREKAQAMIMAGDVYLGEVQIRKASFPVEETADLTVRQPKIAFVSRGALKLQKALQVFGVDPRGCVAMDLGASTGGFTDVLLQGGAAHVYSIDVGYGQLDWKIRNDPRVTVMERTNARYLKPEDLPLHPTLAVMDVSFISITKILPAAMAILGPEGQFITLIKPQFEAGRDRVGKKGVVRDPEVHEAVIQERLRTGRNAFPGLSGRRTWIWKRNESRKRLLTEVEAYLERTVCCQLGKRTCRRNRFTLDPGGH